MTYLSPHSGKDLRAANYSMSEPWGSLLLGKAARSSQLWVSVSSAGRRDMEPSCTVTLWTALMQTDRQTVPVGSVPPWLLPLKTGDVVAP